MKANRKAERNWMLALLLSAAAAILLVALALAADAASSSGDTDAADSAAVFSVRTEMEESYIRVAEALAEEGVSMTTCYEDYEAGYQTSGAADLASYETQMIVREKASFEKQRAIVEENLSKTPWATP